MTVSRRALLRPSIQAADAPGGLALAPPVSTVPVTTAAAHLARRATFTATPAVIARIESIGATRWIDEQLDPARVKDATCDAMLAKHFPWLTKSSAEIWTLTKQRPWQATAMLTRATLARRIVSNRQLFEVVVDVLTNHIYAVGYEKVQEFVVEFDHRVVRKHALGKFTDFLPAAILHPAMLEFLDNSVSTKTDPNENLGRELLELYTVGTGNYTEQDVRNAALLLTGHKFNSRTLTYQFVPSSHHVGPLTIMGYTTANATAAGGQAALRGLLTYLAKHPATAERLCRRLAVRFVADEPSPALINDLIATYQSSGTSIKAVVRRLLLHPEFAASAGRKWRTPAEHLFAMVAAGKPVFRPRKDLVVDPFAGALTVFETLQMARNNPRYWPAVNGYPDDAAHWLTTNKLQLAWSAAEVVAQRKDPEFRPQPWAGLLKISAGQNVWTAAASMTKTLTGYTWATTDLETIATLLANLGAGPAPAPGYVLTAANIANNLPETVRTVFASPYFMLR